MVPLAIQLAERMPRLGRDPFPPVMTQKEVARVLRVSVRQVQILEKAGRFPIPRLPSLDKKPRYAGEQVKRFVGGMSPQPRRKH